MAAEAVEAVAANLCILKSPTVLRQSDGRLWGWEGCDESKAQGPGTCTHVWNFAQAVAHLFPSLERTLRETEFNKNQAIRSVFFFVTSFIVLLPPCVIVGYPPELFHFRRPLTKRLLPCRVSNSKSSGGVHGPGSCTAALQRPLLNTVLKYSVWSLSESGNSPLAA